MALVNMKSEEIKNWNIDKLGFSCRLTVQYAREVSNFKYHIHQNIKFII